MAKTKFMIFVFLILLLGCNSTEYSGSEIEIQIRKNRKDKDLAFKNSPNSPLPGDQKRDFQGLSYFPVDLKYRFQLPLKQYKEKKKFIITTSSGKERDTQKFGYFEFEINGQQSVLQVYKLLDLQEKYPKYLFVPFLDETSGKDCYGGGRYLDIRENDTGFYVLDFNLAYNPSCAYGKAGYNCPIPPMENKLEISIRAGEKNYQHGGH